MNRGFFNTPPPSTRSVSAPAAAARRAASSNVPPLVEKLILLITPVSAASGFFTIYVSVFLLDLGVTAEIVGLVLAVNGLSMVLFAIPLGILSDRKGRRILLAVGGFLFSPMLVILAVTTDTLWLVVVGIMAGAAEAAFLSTWNAMIADATPPAARNAAFSLSFIVFTVGNGAGLVLPFAFPYVSAWTGQSVALLHHESLLLFAVLGAISPIGVLLLRGYQEHLHPAPPRATRLPFRERMRRLRGRASHHRLLIMFSSVNGLIGLGAGFIIPLIGTWYRLRFGIPDSYSGPLLAGANLTMGFAAIASPALAARLGAVRAVVLVQGLSTVFMFALAFVGDPVLAGLLYVIRAALMNMASPVMDAYLMGLVASEERGFASALNSIVWRMPNSVSTAGGGYLLERGQYQSPFLIAGTLYALGVSLFFVMFRSVTPREDRAGVQPGQPA